VQDAEPSAASGLVRPPVLRGLGPFRAARSSIRPVLPASGGRPGGTKGRSHPARWSPAGPPCRLAPARWNSGPAPGARQRHICEPALSAGVL